MLATSGDDADDYKYIRVNVEGRSRKHAGSLRWTLPVAEIEQALQPQTFRYESGVQAIRERNESKVMCPLCDRFSHWNLQLIKEHLASHVEVKEFVRTANREMEKGEQALARKDKIEEQIHQLRQQWAALDRELRTADLSMTGCRMKQAQKLTELLC